MAKHKVKLVKFSERELAYDIPARLNTKGLRRVGRGPETVARLVEQSRRTVLLEPDVYQDFRTAEQVNDALRLVQQLRRTGRPLKRKKSA